MKTSDATNWIEQTSTTRSVGIQRAIMSMQDSLRQYDIKRCEYCFRSLQIAIDTIIDNPNREHSALVGWSTMMRVQQNRLDCDMCKPPLF